MDTRSRLSTHPRDLRRNIWRALLCASDQEIHDGVSFYPGAHGLCALLSIAYRVSIEQVAGIYAALSPLNTWDTNVSNIMTVLRWVNRDRSRDCVCEDPHPTTVDGLWYVLCTKCSRQHSISVNTTGPNQRKAVLIAEGHSSEDVLRGRKVRAFYRGIVDPNDLSPIPVDRHLINLALGTKITDNQVLRSYASNKDLYSRIERAYSELGAREGLGNRLA